MSQINDALQRAKNAQQPNPPPSGMSPMRPIESRPEDRDYGWILAVVIILLVCVAVFFIAKSVSVQTVKQITSAPAVAATQQVETAVSTPLPPPPVIGPAAINTEPPPAIRIQGIVYDPVHPWAIVSGKTVYVGDSVNGMSVAAITRNSVTLVGDGKTNKLLVGQ